MLRIKTIFFIFLSLFSTLTIAKEDQIPISKIQNFVSVYNLLQKNYVDPVQSEQLLNNAIKGMLTQLDPHSAYIAKDDIQRFKKSLDGQYKGFGISIAQQDNKIIIISPIAKSPAEKAGIEKGDQIIKINQIAVGGLSIDEVSQMLADNKDVSLTIYRKKDDKTLDIKITRGDVHLPSVYAKMIDDDYAYIKIAQFIPTTETEFKEQWKELKSEAPKGLIIDLRNNPGGLLNAATGIADLFLKGGLIVSTRNTNTGEDEKIHASTDIYDDTPLLVLINQGSASASELLAGALQDHHRAIIVGEKSFGKGSVQNIFNLPNGDAVKMTIARYYTPNNHSIQAKGITPDFLLSPLTVSQKEANKLAIHEADLQNHLKPSDEKDKPEPIMNLTELAQEDFQLYEALIIFQATQYKAIIPKED